MTIEVKRGQQTEECTPGEVYVDGKFLAYSLELPWRDNQSNVSRIPADTYSTFLRYDGPRGWRIQLKDVEDRELVQIHIGNFPRDTTGCVLLGLSRPDRKCEVQDSAGAMKALRKAFYGTDEPKFTPNKKITVIIKD